MYAGPVSPKHLVAERETKEKLSNVCDCLFTRALKGALQAAIIIILVHNSFRPPGE